MQNLLKLLRIPTSCLNLCTKICVITLFIAITNHNCFAQKNTKFPKYINTGNTTQDDLNYSEAKKQWIAQNPQAYQTMINPENSAPTVISQENFNRMSAEKQAVIKANPALYVIGNDIKTRPYVIDADELSRMSEDKQAMIKANPDKYVIQKSMASSSGKTEVRREELQSMPTEKQALIKANPDTYKIID